jgi:hypothetical protein
VVCASCAVIGRYALHRVSCRGVLDWYRSAAVAAESGGLEGEWQKLVLHLLG